MSINNLHYSSDSEQNRNKSPYSEVLSNKHDSDFIEKNSNEQAVAEITDKLCKMAEDVHPAFKDQFAKYSSEVIGLISENVVVANDSGVQKELATQNARVELTLAKNAGELTANRAYRSIFNSAVNKKSANDNYYGDDLDQVA